MRATDIHICTAETCPAGFYYITAVDGALFYWMAGPYSTHAEALADVLRARELADENDPRAWFMAWGTARSDRDRGSGSLNRAGLLAVAA